MPRGGERSRQTLLEPFPLPPLLLLPPPLTPPHQQQQQQHHPFLLPSSSAFSRVLPSPPPSVLHILQHSLRCSAAPPPRSIQHFPELHQLLLPSFVVDFDPGAVSILLLLLLLLLLPLPPRKNHPDPSFPLLFRPDDPPGFHLPDFPRTARKLLVSWGGAGEVGPEARGLEEVGSSGADDLPQAGCLLEEEGIRSRERKYLAEGRQIVRKAGGRKGG
eukprot:768337-Hanusia_phi.AAC.3